MAVAWYLFCCVVPSLHLNREKKNQDPNEKRFPGKSGSMREQQKFG